MDYGDYEAEDGSNFEFFQRSAFGVLEMDVTDSDRDTACAELTINDAKEIISKLQKFVDDNEVLTIKVKRKHWDQVNEELAKIGVKVTG